MGLIPRAFIDELLNQTNLVEFIDGYVPLKKQGTSHVACCPFHQEKNPSFNVVDKKQFYHCFGCGVSGNAISFAMNYLNQNFSDAVETLAARMGIQVPREGNTPPNRAQPTLYQLLEKVALFYQKTLNIAGDSALGYIAQRGLSDEVVQAFQLGFAPAGWNNLDTANLRQWNQELITTGMLIKKDSGGTYDRYRNRLMFPIHDRNGRIIGFGGRALDNEQKPKYLNSPETVIFQKNRELYGLHHVLKNNPAPSCILVVEGYLDVIALAQWGIPYAVATLGTTASTYHIQLLAKHTQRIVFCFDGDAAGRKAAWRALDNSLASLNSGLDIGFMFLPEAHDPDSFIRSEGTDAFHNVLAKSVTLNQFFFDTLLQETNLNTLAGKSQLIYKAKPYLTKLPDGAYRELLLNELSRYSHLDLARIEQLLTQDEPTHTQPQQHIKRTPLRLAIALILQNPELYASLRTELPSSRFNTKNLKVLHLLMQHIETFPNAISATLIETFRDASIFNALNQLVAWEHQVPTDAIKKELIDTLLFLAQQAENQTIEVLIERARQQSLNASERQQLQNMLKNRHGIKPN